MVSNRFTLPRSVVYVAAAITVGLGVWSIFAWRASVATKNQHDQVKLCHVLYTIIEQSNDQIGKKGTVLYTYFLTHLDELANAQARGKQILSELPCK